MNSVNLLLLALALTALSPRSHGASGNLVNATPAQPLVSHDLTALHDATRVLVNPHKGWYHHYPDTRCSPGTFLAWLVNKGVRVQGVRVSAGWCDAGEHKQLTGPSLLRFRQIVREIVNPTYSTWERAAGQRLQWISSHRDLLDVLEKTEREPDPNLRIVACDVLGRLSEFVDEIARNEIEQHLKAVLADHSANDISGGEMQSDEDSATYVSSIAAASLARLGYATDTESVFMRAEGEGYRVCRH